MNPKPVPMPRPLPISLAAAVRVLCSENKMYVRVRTDLYGFKCKAGQLTLGTSCRSNGVSGGYLLFTYGLKECGSQASVEAGQLVYKNVLKYVPSVQNSTIRRSMPFTVPLQCRYYRYHHVYRHGIRPLWRNPTRFKSLKTPYGFALKIINGDWVPERMMNTFYLGQPIHFQATTNLTIPGTKLFIHSCYATASPASNSTPRYTVIENYGCMVDSKYETCSSHFVPPRTNNTINLIVDAFQFNTLSPLVNKYYMHCTMVVTSNSMVTQSTKSCHYDKNVNRWVELEGNHSVCSCCDSVCINEDVTLPIVSKSTISSDALLVLEKQGGDDGERKTGAAILELEEDLLSYEGVSKEDREALSPEDDAFDENDYNRLLDVEAEGNDNSDDPNQHLEDTFDASKVPEHSDTENYEGAGEPGHFEEADEWRALSAEEAGGN
ncbi:zona pellucida sperm-binding protein 3-like [Huso huso]|uniref:Zona pellucida sperm-binding protein 3-like n=1 Tax=Huso huso TaxID=61971 RepID=A0ABR0Y0I7_HUSHU